MSLVRWRHMTPGLLAILFLGWTHPARADGAESAKHLVLSVVDDASRTFAGKAMGPEQRMAELRRLMATYGDVSLTSQDILGHYWARARSDQQQDFAHLMLDYIIGSWADHMADMPRRPRIDITGTQNMPTGRTVVHSVASGGTPVDWTVTETPDGRPVISDVAVEGISIVETLRGDFTSILRTNGGRLQALLDALRQKIASYQANLQ